MPNQSLTVGDSFLLKKTDFCEEPIFADGTRIVQEIPKKTRELLDAVNLGIEWR